MIVLTDANFEAKLKDPDATWLLEFYAPWCGHCKEMAPAFEQAATELKGVAFVGKCDVTANERARFKFGVNAFPGIMVIHMHKLCKCASRPHLTRRSALFLALGRSGMCFAQFLLCFAQHSRANRTERRAVRVLQLQLQLRWRRP